MRRPRQGYTQKQFAYAQRTFGGEGVSKRQIALDIGYSESVANHPGVKIEASEGYSNAMSALASETGNFALQIFHALKHKDLSKESVPVLMNSLQTIAKAWETFTPKQQVNKGETDNPLRTILLQRVDNQTINAIPPEKE